VKLFYKLSVLSSLLTGMAIPAMGQVDYVSRCGGGEGPHPLFDISDQFPSHANILVPHSGVEEFTYLESRSELVYRTKSGTLISRPEVGPSKTLGCSAVPISPVVEEEKMYFSAKGLPFLSDTSFQWREYQVPSTRGLTHLFWESGSLYSLDRSVSSTGMSHIYKYRPFEGAAKNICNLTGLTPAEGHAFPYVYYYALRPRVTGPYLNVYTVDVRSCKIVHELEFAEPLMGKVLSVHRFEELKAAAVEVDHPTQNLLWFQTDKGCGYYNLNNQKGISDARLRVMNYKSPWMATFSPSQGLSLVNFALQNRARIPSLIKARDIQSIYLTDTGDRIFLNPLFESSGFRSLLEIKLPLH